MRTMIRIHGKNNDILGMYDNEVISSLTHMAGEDVASVKLVTGECVEFKGVTSVKIDDIYSTSELEAINRNREMSDNYTELERYQQNQASNQNMEFMMNNTLKQIRQMMYGQRPQHPMYQQQHPQPNTQNPMYQQQQYNSQPNMHNNQNHTCNAESNRYGNYNPTPDTEPNNKDNK